jgi:hypothetical protein
MALDKDKTVDLMAILVDQDYVEAGEYTANLDKNSRSATYGLHVFKWKACRSKYHEEGCRCTYPVWRPKDG